MLERVSEAFGKAIDLYAAKKYTQAISEFEFVRQKAARIGPLHKATLHNLGMCNLELKRYAAAIMYFEQAIAAHGADKDTSEKLERAKAAYARTRSK